MFTAGGEKNYIEVFLSSKFFVLFQRTKTDDQKFEHHMEHDDPMVGRPGGGSDSREELGEDGGNDGGIWRGGARGRRREFGDGDMVLGIGGRSLGMVARCLGTPAGSLHWGERQGRIRRCVVRWDQKNVVEAVFFFAPKDKKIVFLVTTTLFDMLLEMLLGRLLILFGENSRENGFFSE